MTSSIDSAKTTISPNQFGANQKPDNNQTLSSHGKRVRIHRPAVLNGGMELYDPGKFFGIQAGPTD